MFLLLFAISYSNNHFQACKGMQKRIKVFFFLFKKMVLLLPTFTLSLHCCMQYLLSVARSLRTDSHIFLPNSFSKAFLIHRDSFLAWFVVQPQRLMGGEKKINLGG